MNSAITLVVPLLLLFSSFLLFGDVTGVESSKHHHQRNLYGSTKLFVFGNSNVDTGNLPTTFESWGEPYGMTYPGTPSGRYSDGRLSTDYLALFLGIESPVPYQWKDDVEKDKLQYGMNFGYGGSGVFDTVYIKGLDMTYQIGLFEKLIGDIYSPSDLSSSVALVSIAGNDYFTHITDNGYGLSIFEFMRRVINQIEVNLRRIHALGVKTIAVPTLQPLGCLPMYTKGLSYRRCSDIINALTIVHNNALRRVVARLNRETEQSPFIVIDYFKAFFDVIDNNGQIPGVKNFTSLYVPCCGITGYCGTVHENGEKNYTLCDDPSSNFYWDGFHPSEEGWKAVYSVLTNNLKALLPLSSYA
ncbi:PREDICTED: GDSL esterase/lipase At5g03610-like [Camelina sativa]|uniref:GDSL esterase/lipase At5g03610-like n=1 Tax=Camelina sativa TaxID=90675 RepID=A0ABM0XTJ9_CAMSA|nr:PREDICTED: GDSL esterase/lipase At5g03610-like [Camelina sativa]